MHPFVQTALSILDAYIQRFHPEVTDELLYQLIRRILPKLGDRALLEAEIVQLTEQIISEFHLPTVPVPPPDRAAEQIALQVADEIAQFRAEQAAALPPLDVTQAHQTADLEVSSQLEAAPLTGRIEISTASFSAPAIDRAESE